MIPSHFQGAQIPSMISHQESHLKHQLVPGIDFDLVGISSLCTVLDVFTQFCLFSRDFHFFLRFWSIFYALGNCRNFSCEREIGWRIAAASARGGEGAAPNKPSVPLPPPPSPSRGLVVCHRRGGDGAAGADTAGPLCVEKF